MRVHWMYICKWFEPTIERCLWWVRIPLLGPVEVAVELRSPPGPPWFGGEGIRPELAHDLQVLATMNVLAQTMTEGPKDAAIAFVHSQIETLELPEGTRVVFEHDVQRGDTKA